MASAGLPTLPQNRRPRLPRTSQGLAEITQNAYQNVGVQ